MKIETELLDRAEELIKKYGALNLSMTEVHHGVCSSSHMFRFFKSKNSLLARLCVREMMSNVEKLKSDTPDYMSRHFKIVTDPFIYDYLSTQDKYMVKYYLDIFLSKLRKSNLAGIIGFKQAYDVK
ncbi:hypothetical protein Sps_04065 [Shewanella psychrophila]|uniref:Transcriptional regulator, TetR family n=1 Tax=Shewanella psychrophila TaxID=225848 RepID=A0A1S6HUE5_9GAMM|nr:hypothetical protein [Shewanella psychrophila]AQS39180.1 hypothetical protein Sps_04065 [Shewanella psychrophila]